MKLYPLTAADCEKARCWRNQCPETLRTPHMLTEQEQRRFYEERVCNPNSPHRYWAICGTIGDTYGDNDADGYLLGMGGLTYICHENRIAEISLIMNPELTGHGFGTKAVDLLFHEGFGNMSLKTIIAECYTCNTAGLPFWEAIAVKYQACRVMLPNRKFWNGQFWNSIYFSFDATIAMDKLETMRKANVHGDGIA